MECCEVDVRTYSLTVLSVQLLDLEDIFAGLNGIEVELIPPSESRKSWAWNMRQGMKEQTAHGACDCEQGSRNYCRGEDLKDSHGNLQATQMGMAGKTKG